MSIPTQITITPDRPLDKPIFGVRTPGDRDSFADADVTASDVLDVINPLHQIPFVSELYSAATGDTASTAARLIGGAILGGPIGFIAGLASVIFEQETGQGVIGAVASALTGSEDAPVQVAKADAAPVAAVTEEASRQVSQVEILPPQEVTPLKAQHAVERGKNMPIPVSVSGMHGNTVNHREKDEAVLSLFGGQLPSAHRSYQKAQMLPYLQDVSSSMVL